MATANENVTLAPKTLPRQTSNTRPNKVANGATEPSSAGGGVLKCACFRLPSRSSKNKPLLPSPPPPPAIKLSRSASSRSAVAPDAPAASSQQQSQRVTFRASASLSTWWPASPSAGAGAAGGSVAPRRASASANAGGAGAGAPRASSSSFSHWRRSLSSRVMPHGERASFSFPTSPASATSSCMSTPKIPQAGCQQGYLVAVHRSAPSV